MLKELTSSQSSVDPIDHNRRADNRTEWTARTIRSAGLLKLLAQTAGTARTASESASVENLFTRWRHLHWL